MTALTLATKKCTRCGVEKPLTAFNRHTGASDGRQQRCRSCDRETSLESKARRRAEMGEEAWLAYQREATRKARQNSEVRARQKLSTAAYREALHALRRLHQSQFDALLARERYERGLHPTPGTDT